MSREVMDKELVMLRIAIDPETESHRGALYGVATDGVVYEFEGRGWVSLPMNVVREIDEEVKKNWTTANPVPVASSQHGG